MASTTSIEWAANADGTPGATWNPVRARDRGTGKVGTHCVHASDGCRHCYAETFNLRGLPGAGTGLAYTKPNEAKVDIFLDETMLAAPLKRRKPTTYFLSSMTDVFADFVSDAMLDRLFAVMALSPRHTFIVLTKRAKRMREYFSRAVGRHGSMMSSARDSGFCIEREMRIREATAPLASLCPRDDSPVRFPLPNVWLVVSVEDNANRRRVFDLLETPAAVRGVSIEPMLGPVDLVTGRNFLERIETDNNGPILPGLDWVICGGESGGNARPMHPDWARSLRDQCAAAGVPFFFKQWGEHRHVEIGPHEPPSEHLACIDARGRDCALSFSDGHWWFLAPTAASWTSVRAIPEGLARATIRGKAKTGRLLDGVAHNARPPLSTEQGEALATRAASPGRHAS